MQSYVNKIVGAAGWRSLCGNPILFWQLPGEHSRSFSSLRLWICVQLVSKNRTSHDWWCCSITTGSVNSQLFVTSLQNPWRGDIVSVLLRLVSAAPKWANQVQGSHQAWIRQTCLACKACWSWRLFFLLTEEFLFSCFLIRTLSPHRTMKCFRRQWKQIQWNNFWNWREEGGVLCSILTPFPKQTTTNPPTHPPFAQMEALYSVSICTTGSVHSLSMPWWRMPNILYSTNPKTHFPPTAPLDS